MAHVSSLYQHLESAIDNKSMSNENMLNGSKENAKHHCYILVMHVPIMRLSRLIPAGVYEHMQYNNVSNLLTVCCY